MQTSQVVYKNLLLFETLSPIVEGQNADIYTFEIDAMQLCRHGMEDIREKIRGVCEGQDRVVMSQLWELGKKSPVGGIGGGIQGAINRAPTSFPALVMHGFVVERMVDGHTIWEPCSPYLKDFWQVGIHVSNGHGFLLLPEHVFHANVDAYVGMI